MSTTRPPEQPSEQEIQNLISDIQSHTHSQGAHPKVAVFSTQSIANKNPALTHDQIPEFIDNNPDINFDKTGNGHTGLAIARALHANFAVIRTIDKNKPDEQKNIDFSKAAPLENNSLLVITGHGSPGGDDIQGDYIDQTGYKSTRYRQPEDIVTSAMSSGLKSGDTVNILLSICFGAAKPSDGSSYAEKLAKAFAEQGISTNIIASDKPVKRFGSNAILENGTLTFNDSAGIAAKDTHIFTTNVSEPTNNPTTTIIKPNKSVRLSENGLEFVGAPAQVLSDEDTIRDALQKNIPLTKKYTVSPFLNSQGAEKALKHSYEFRGPPDPRPLDFIIRSSTVPGYMAITYYNTKFEAEHRLINIEELRQDPTNTVFYTHESRGGAAPQKTDTHFIEFVKGDFPKEPKATQDNDLNPESAAASADTENPVAPPNDASNPAQSEEKNSPATASLSEPTDPAPEPSKTPETPPAAATEATPAPAPEPESPTPKTRVYCDFDGTLTGLGGENTFKAFRKKYNQSAEEATTDQIKEFLNDPDNEACRVLDTAKTFLAKLAINPNIELVIVSKNKETWIRTALAEAGVSQEIVQSIPIIDRSSVRHFNGKQKAVAAYEENHPTTGPVFAIDDTPSDCKAMLQGSQPPAGVYTREFSKDPGEFPFSIITKDIEAATSKHQRQVAAENKAEASRAEVEKLRKEVEALEKALAGPPPEPTKKSNLKSPDKKPAEKKSVRFQDEPDKSSEVDALINDLDAPTPATPPVSATPPVNTDLLDETLGKTNREQLEKDINAVFSENKTDSRDPVDKLLDELAPPKATAQPQTSAPAPAATPEPRAPISSTLTAQQPPAPAKINTTERSKPVFSKDTINHLRTTLESAGWTIGDFKSPNGAKAAKESDGIKQCFYIKPDKIDTNDVNQDTFETMLKAFKAANPGTEPQITTQDENAVELWKKAMAVVYPGVEPKISLQEKKPAAEAAPAAPAPPRLH